MLRNLLAGASASLAALVLFGNVHGGTVTYSYDSAGRLVSADYANGSRIAYTYDAAGNVTKREVKRVGSTVGFSAPDGQEAETTSPVMIPVDLSLAETGTVKVNYAVTGGTATPGTGRSAGDFLLAAGELEFDPGDTQELIELTVYDDDEIEGAETVVITLSSPTNAELGTITEFTYTITDEDTDEDDLSDDWERLYFGDLDQNGGGDPDEDGDTNAQEAAASTDPTGKSWELAIGITESHVQTLTLGMSHFATEAVDPGLDVLSPPAPPDLRYAAFLTDGLLDLVTDLRGVHVNGIWTLMVTAAENVTSRATSVLTWAPADVREEGLRLLEVDADGNPVTNGTDIDMAQAAEVSVPNGDTVYFQLQFGDCDPPTVEITSKETSATNAAVIPVTITFNEVVDGFTVDDLTVGNGDAGNLQTTDNTLFTADITPIADGLVTVDIAAAAAQDSTGNDNTAAAQFAIASDQTDPTVGITSTETSPSNAAVIPVTITFSEVVNGFTLEDLTVGNGAADNLQTTDDTVFTADITPAADGQVTVDIAAAVAQDPADNDNTAAAQFAIASDQTAPTVEMTTASDPTADSPIVFTLSFLEEVIGFDIEDLAATNGTATDLIDLSETTPGLAFTVNVTPAYEGLVTLSAAEGAATDVAGNPTEAGEGSVTYDPDPSVLWTVAGGVTGAQTDTIRFGMALGASDGYNVGLDVLADDPGQDDGYVAFVSEGLDDLTTDIRGQEADLATWQLRLTAPTGRGDAVFSWDPAQLPVVRLSLVETDDQWQPLPEGTNIDMGKTSSPSVSAASGTTRYFTILYRHAVFMLAVHDGWNLLSVPIQPFDTAVAAVLQDAPVGPAWAWNPIEGHYEAVTTVEAKKGFWVFYVAEAQRETKYVAISGQRVQTPIQSVKTGWNLLAPVANPPYDPVSLPLVVTPSVALGDEALWEWTGLDYGEANSLVPGLSYWGMAAEDADVRVGD